MKLLLDTHTFLWSISNPTALSEKAQNAFLNPKNELYFSAASYWEICIKQSLGKLRLAQKWEESIDRELSVNQIKWLKIEKAHCQALVNLPFHHRDPFDRLLIAQAKTEKLTLMTKDQAIQKYLKTLW